MREPLKLVLNTPAARLPLELNELRAQLRLDDDQTLEDAVLLAGLRAASEACERFTGRALITQIWTLFRDAWPLEDDGAGLREGWREGVLSERRARALALPRPPLQSVVHVKTFAEDDTETVWPASNYVVDAAGLPGRLVARSGQAFPAPGRAANGIEVRFVAGHGDAPGDVPEALRQGILRLAAHLHEHRGDAAGDAAGGATSVTAQAASGAAALWRPFVVARL